MSEHTPGPWTVSPGPISDWWVEGPAWVYPTPGDCALEEADARLIAAAPELLEALERIAEPEVVSMGDARAMQQEARAAIAKARGGSLTPE